MERLRCTECQDCKEWDGTLTNCCNICAVPFDAMHKFNKYKDLQEKLDKQFDGCLSIEEFTDSIIEYDKQCSRNEELAEAMLITNEDARQYREWKRLKKQGKLPEFPCTVGDTVYEINKIRETISTFTVKGFSVSEHGVFVKWKLSDGIYRNLDGFNDDEIGKTVFLTREDAEQALERSKEE